MATQFTHHCLFDKRPIGKSRTRAAKWVKEWVPQDLVTTGGKCLVLKWVTEATSKAMNKKSKEAEAVKPDPEPEPTKEVLFLCSFEGCGNTFIDAVALRKHSHVHGERQHVCHYENCGKKFSNNTKLRRHFLSHTGERNFLCPYEGCGKAFSLDFNLTSHMKTHLHESNHVCPYPECGKRYTHKYRLRTHLASKHEKLCNNVMDTPKHTPPPERTNQTPKILTGPSGPVTADRPYGCPYEGCGKAYIHAYKLNLHLRREHPGHFPKENVNEMDEINDQDGYARKRDTSKIRKINRPKPIIMLPPSKASLHQKSFGAGGAAAASGVSLNVLKKDWPAKEEMYEEEYSEETEEEREDVGNGWRYGEKNEENDDEETEDEQ